jgi:apolipoprotein N-acyltransferase
VIAANTGFSASINGSGRILQKGPRHEADTLLAEVQLDTRRSFYLEHGDWPAGICFACCIFFTFFGISSAVFRKVLCKEDKGEKGKKGK